MGTPELQNGCIVTQASIPEVNMQIECCYVISIYMQQVAFNFLDEAFSFGRFFIWKPELTHFKLCLVWITWSEVQKVFLEAASTNDGWVDSGSCLIPLRICLFSLGSGKYPDSSKILTVLAVIRRKKCDQILHSRDRTKMFLKEV